MREHLHIAAGVADAPAVTCDRGAEHQTYRRNAAVLIALVKRAQGLTLVLTRRTAHLKDHANQISFPGGRMEPEDANAAATALREAHEEIGLDRERVDVLGGLRSYNTVTGFLIHPIVGWIEEPQAHYHIDPDEVAAAFEIPINHIIDPANHRQDSYRRQGEERRYFVIPYREHYIWGATAGMLVGFTRLLRTDFSS